MRTDPKALKMIIGIGAAMVLGVSLALGAPVVQSQFCGENTDQANVAYAKTITSNTYKTKYFTLKKASGKYISSWTVKKKGKRTWYVGVDYSDEGGGGVTVCVSKKAPKNAYGYYRVGKSKGYKVYLCSPAGGNAIAFTSHDYLGHTGKLQKHSKYALVMKLK